MVSETIELRGHIIDSLILPKVLDQILTHGANFKIGEIKIGERRADQSFARIEVSAETSEALDELVLRLRQHGAEVIERANVQLASAPADGVFPSDFYVTTNQQTFIRFDGKEIEVRPAMINSAIALDRKKESARAVKFFDVNKGNEIVVGHQGVRVVPVQRSTTHTDIFQFINTVVDADEPKSAIIRELGEESRRAHAAKVKIAIRDEGPIPGVTTDIIEAQKVMRQKLADVTRVMMLATVQHSLAVASMLAPAAKTVCVDIETAAVERVVEHQPLQSIGLVTDVEPFLRELAESLSESRVRE